MIANIKPLSLRVKQLILRHWYRGRYSPDYHPLHKMITQYNTEIPDNTNHPLILASKILRDNKHNITINHKIQPIQGPITALPIYKIHKIPSNYHINIKPIKITDISPIELNFFTDGSCVPNPGKGSYGWYTPNCCDSIPNQIMSYTYPITITNCELMAILLTLQHIKNSPPDQHKVNIFTDCKTALQYLNFDSYPKYNNIRLIVQTILRILLLIQNQHPEIKIYSERLNPIQPGK